VNPIASRLWFRPRVMIKQLGQAHSSSMRLFERQGLRNALSDMGRTSGQPFCGYTPRYRRLLGFSASCCLSMTISFRLLVWCCSWAFISPSR
jgi:hypothetical protein